LFQIQLYDIVADALPMYCIKYCSRVTLHCI